MTSDPLTGEQARALVASCGGGLAGLRNRAHLTTLYRAGLRNWESTGQQLEDVRFDAGGGCVLRVTRPKGLGTYGRHRELGIGPEWTRHIRAWIDMRGAGDGLLFWTIAKREIDTSHIRRLLLRLRGNLGMRRRVHPHALRHSFARECYDAGMGVREIQLALGHESLETTQTYLASIGATRVVSMLLNREE